MTKYKDKLEDDTIEIALKIPFFLFFRNRIKESNNYVYLITDKGLMRYKLIGFEKMVENYLIKGHLISALKIINNLFMHRIHASDKERHDV